MAEQAKNNLICGAKLRAKRELCGLSREELAKECGCDQLDVRALEEPWHNVGVPDDVAVALGARLDELQERMGDMLDYAVGVYEEFAEIAQTNPEFISMPYYRDQAEYDEYGRKGDGMSHSFVNAVTRACLAAFDDFGMPCRLYYPAEDEELRAMVALSRGWGDSE